MGLGMPAPLPPPGAGTTTIMTTMGAMAGNMTSSMRSGMSSTPQCRQPPAYKVVQQMARLHRLGRANSHEGVTYRGTDHEDGTCYIQPNRSTVYIRFTLTLIHTSIRFTLVQANTSFLHSCSHCQHSARSADLLAEALCQFTTVGIA